MFEVTKNFENREIADVPKENSSFLEIKNESKITSQEATEYWNDIIEEKYDGLNTEYDLTNITEIAKTGGSYGELRIVGEGDQYEVHHIPAKSASELPINDGPAIKMDKSDHRLTASCGASLEAIEYREEQRKRIDNGDFIGAIQMDIEDLSSKFGSKYDIAINEMLDYVVKLQKEGKISA
jgi:hypothetical protein